MVLADAGYDAEHDHRLWHEELGMRRSVIAFNSPQDQAALAEHPLGRLHGDIAGTIMRFMRGCLDQVGIMVQWRLHGS
jgi:hypothetical protein